MTETVQLRIPGPAAASDPLGYRWLNPEERSPGPEWVEAEVVEEHSDGTLTLKVGHPTRAGRLLPNVEEGADVGQYRRRSGGLERRALRSLRQTLAPLLQDSDSQVRGAAEVVAALFGRGTRAEVLGRLQRRASNARAGSAQRVQALTLIGVLLAQEVDR